MSLNNDELMQGTQSHPLVNHEHRITRLELKSKQFH
jgi:hypothetical protein